MKKSKFAQTQIVQMLEEADAIVQDQISAAAPEPGVPPTVQTALLPR